MWKKWRKSYGGVGGKIIEFGGMRKGGGRKTSCRMTKMEEMEKEVEEKRI